ncbi:MAG: hypothetical protein LBR85_07985 [Oscillospiraceae bacterium]|nr:hypothetical protein [Oscillospiraceae bacterium]
MSTGALFKGLGIGVIAGAVITAAVVPVDMRKIRHSKPAKAIKAIGRVVEGISDSIS